MGVSKPLTLRSGQHFEKAGDAEFYFQQILNGGELRVCLIDDEHTAIDALFRDYCAATEWTMPGVPLGYFRDINRVNERITKSFYVKYDRGEPDDFSYIKAVRAVANWKR